jgi:hypothetical protein
LLSYASLMAKAGTAPREPRCSFCGKSQYQVQKVVAGPGVHICNECVDLCNDIMDEAGGDSSPESASVAHRYAEWKVLTPNDPTAIELWTLQRHLMQAARQLARLQRFSTEGAVVAKGDRAWRELGPDTPAALELRILQRQLTETARQLAAVVVALETSADSERP